MAKHTVPLLALAALVCASCGPGGLAPVEETKPSADARILQNDGLMSDGTPVLVHVTDTIDSSIDMPSSGGIGGISVDRDGNLYNTNFSESVWRTAPDGETILLNGEFTSASGNLVMPDGDLLQCDWTDNKVFRIRPDGSRSVFSDLGLDGPVGIVQRPAGDFIVANHRGKFLARIPETGGRAEVVLRDPRLQAPNGVTIDPEGNVYIADLDVGTVFKFTPQGELLELAQLPGKGNSHNVYAMGALYVNKIWDHVIYRVDLETGAYGIVSGNGHAGYQDGITGIATIEEPNGIATNHTKDVVYFNTHRGAMFRSPGLVIIRRLRLAEGDSGPLALAVGPQLGQHPVTRR